MKTFTLAALVATAFADSPDATDLDKEHDPTMALGQSVELSTDLDRVAAMDTDDDFVFTATATKIVKMNADSMTDYSFEDFGASHGVTEITSLRTDADHVYMTAAVGQAWKMYKLDKKTMTPACVYDYEAHENIPYSMQHDDNYVYTGQYTSPGKVVRISKDGCHRHGETLELGEGENDIRAMEFDAAHDADHLYANTNTAPGRVVKIDLTSWARASAVTLNDHENYLLSGSEQDADHVYVGTNTRPGRIVKIAKATMTRVGGVTLKSGERSIISMDSDGTHIYAPTYSTPPSVVRVRKENMEREDAIKLPSSFTAGISAITHVGGNLIAGIDSAPASFGAISGYLQPNDCVMGAWGPWSTCNRGAPRADGLICGTGVESRERSVTKPAAFGGKACSTELKTYKRCGHGVCPVECAKGTKKKWVPGKQSAVPTCNLRNPPSVTTKMPGCECPPELPYWHAESVCVSAAECDKDLKPCDDTTCIYQNGKVQVHHPKSTGDASFPESGFGGFQCHHRPGRTGDCSCLCHTKSDSPSDETFVHTIPKTNPHGGATPHLYPDGTHDLYPDLHPGDSFQHP